MRVVAVEGDEIGVVLTREEAAFLAGSFGGEGCPATWERARKIYPGLPLYRNELGAHDGSIVELFKALDKHAYPLRERS